MKSNFVEPFLVNPPKRFSFKRMLSGLGNPFRKHRKVARRRIKRNPLADLMIMNAPRKHKKRIIRHRRKIISRSTGRSDLSMAKRRKRRNAPKKHRLSLIGHRVSKRSRLAPRHRGMLINSVGLKGILPSMATIQDVAGITAGYAVVRLVPKYIYPVIGFSKPAGILGTATDVLVVVAVSTIAGKVLGRPAIGKALLVGGLVAVAVDLLGQTGVLSDAGMGYILPPSQLSSYQIPLQVSNDSEYEDSRR